MNMPSFSDISVFGSNDEEAAARIFLGKSISEAETLFVENDLYYLCFLYWMGPKAFCYYIIAAINYLKSEASIGHPHAVDIFYSVLTIRMQNCSSIIDTIIPDIREAILYVIKNWNKFEVDPTNYKNLKTKYKKLLKDVTDKSPE